MNTNYIHIAYDLIFRSPFHCGTGLSEGLIDRTIVRDSEGYLYIPGSTTKGVVREHCEQLARFYQEPRNTDEAFEELIASPHEGEKALLGLGHTRTIITRIFGSQNHPGLLFFDDAHQTEDQKKQYDSREKERGKGEYKSLQTNLYTQVRLDRPTRTAIKGALYTSEFGTRDLLFHGAITGWLNCTSISEQADMPSYSLLLLLAGLHMLQRIGGNKSTGKGQCQCSITQVTVGNRTYERKQWQSWFDQLAELSHYSMLVSLEEEEV
jgi:CRISPR/Cas system CMR subunit Cmr4 (Cas7 group RAMP superfamily)